MQEKNDLVIHGDNLLSNYRLIRDHYKSDYPLYAVVKSNAYGHGIQRVARILYEAGHRHFGVFHVREAYLLRDLYKDINILVLGDTPHRHIHRIKDLSIDIGIFSEKEWRRYLSEGVTDCSFHIMLETGLNRMGISNIYNREFLELISKSQANNCALSFYSHISAAPEREDENRVKSQYRVFAELINYLQNKVDNINQIHFYNSANLPFHESHQYGARVGLLLYGYAPIENQSAFPWLGRLKPVMEIQSRISQVKTVRKGSHIGYGLSYQCPSDRKVGFIPVGYADGILRALSNKGNILTEYGKVPIIGNVNMDLIAVDLSDFPSVKEGDQVIILGANSQGSLLADEIADNADTIPYEILTSMGNQGIWGNYG